MKKYWGLIITCILAVFYLWAGTAILAKVVNCGKNPSQDAPCITLNSESDAGKPEHMIHENWFWLFSTLGGLVSAIVIAELAIAKIGTSPGGSIVFGFRSSDVSKLSEREKKFVSGVTNLYVVCWLAIGVAMVIIGLINFPNISDTMNTLAKGWIGLAIGAVYAYLGIDPDKLTS